MAPSAHPRPPRRRLGRTCLDELNDFIASLEQYSPTILAVALRVHLEGLLHALLQGKMCTPEEVREFVRELERDALQYEGD